MDLEEIKQLHRENSLAVQWLGLGAFTAVARVQSPVGKLKMPKAARGNDVQPWLGFPTRGVKTGWGRRASRGGGTSRNSSSPALRLTLVISEVGVIQ